MEISSPDVGMATWTHRGVEVWGRAAGVATRRHGGMEISGPDVGMATWTNRGVEVWRLAAAV